jgi:hypothetical protein
MVGIFKIAFRAANAAREPAAFPAGRGRPGPQVGRQAVA